MKSLLIQIANQQLKPAVVAVRSGDTVRVHQRIKEGAKQRTQVFEGLVIRVNRKHSLTYRITVRRVTSGVGVEKGFMMHSPNVEKVEVLKRSKVRRNYLSYLRQLTGKSARLKTQAFNSPAVNQPKSKPTADKPAQATPTKAAKATPKAQKPPQANTSAKTKPATKPTKNQTKSEKPPAKTQVAKPKDS